METTTWWQILAAIIGALGGMECIKWLFNRRANTRVALAQADKADAEANQQEWQLEQQRLEESHKTIMVLNDIIKQQSETISSNNRALDDKTLRLREAQDREFKANEENAKLSAEKAALIEKIGKLELRLQRHECIKLNCTHRDPPNEHTHAARNKTKSATSKAS